ncbi:porin [Pseudoduganella dura]|uniref:porin n=1 Tax=Pseudoduganella dura TaxID=321982 RepID=UPI001E2A0211|nr:porin [Pseudoduganella dura]
MNKTAAMLLMCGAAAAQAQTSVTLYGIVDAAVVGESGGSAGHVAKVTSGAASASRIGFRGTEDLGNGLAAIFTLETGTRIDTGEVDAAGAIFNRQAFVGLKGRFGTVAIGRQFTPYHTTLVNVVDPFGTSYAGRAGNLFPDSGTNVRTSNTITYAMPRSRGIDAELAYSAGEQADSSAGRQFGGAIGYTAGPLAVRLAYNSKNSDVAASAGTAAIDRSQGRNLLLGASYQLGRIRLHAGYGVDKGDNSAPLANAGNPYGGVKPTASTDGRELLLGFSAPAGPGNLMFSAMHKDDRTGFDQDAGAWGVAYLVPLSKRTGVYGAYGHVRNRNGAGYTVGNNTESGSGSTGYNLGLRHTF